MSKVTGTAGGDVALSSFPSPQQQKGISSGKSNITPRNSPAGNQFATSSAQKIPRNTHRHHRKPEANLNHLLNFSYAPTTTTGHSFARKHTRVTPTYGRGSGYHPLDKAHFVNANYRFVVNPGGDYRPNLVEADVPVPWESVLQVLASVQTQCNACPICLESVPIAPRMAKCGHVFCLPCALRYLDSEDVKTGKTTGKWRKCPICFDGVYAAELRPVRWFEGDDMLPVKGQDVTLQLIRRKNGSMFALPRDASPIKEDSVPWYNQNEVIEHARLLKGDAEYMNAQAEREVLELLLMKDQDEKSFGDEGHWTATAIENIQDTSSIYEALGNAPTFKSAPESPPKRTREPIQYLNTHETQQTSYTEKTRDSAANHIESSNGDAYYFYQPRTGCHFYLAPLDIRVLKRAFTSFSSFPSALIAKVEHTSTVTIDEDLRRRTKYLSHLPLGCEVTFLECDWSGVLEQEVLDLFKVETDKRRKKRHDKAVLEESARRKAQAADERKERAGLGELLWRDEDTSYFARNAESNTYDVFADEQHHTQTTLSGSPSTHSGSLPTGSLERRSVWGTALPPGQETQEPAEEDDWKEQLEKFYEESALASSPVESTTTASGKNGGGRKKQKKKLVLLSSGGGRGMG